MKNAFILSALCLVFSAPSEAQDLKSQLGETLQEFEMQIYRADLSGMKSTQQLLQRLFDHDDLGYLAHYNFARAEEQVAYMKQEEDKGAYIDHLNTALDHLEKSTEMKADFAEAYALMASLTGQKAGVQRIRAMFLGPKADRYMDKATELDPDNPRVVLVRAVSDFNKPKMFGGDKERAMKGFVRAQELAKNETITDPTLPSFGEAEAHAWMGVSQQALGNIEGAAESFDTALKIQPEYGWVSKILIPRLEKAKN